MEITIYNKKGMPCAYIATDVDHTIYLWNGQPVAYLDNENIYGFNGKHLGWFKRKRVMYDKNGLRIGFTNVTCPSALQVEPKKSAKKNKPAKTAKTVPTKETDFKLSKSKTNLSDFLKGGC